MLLSPRLQSAAGLVWCSWGNSQRRPGRDQLLLSAIIEITDTASPLLSVTQQTWVLGPLPSETIIILQTVIDSPTETLNVPRDPDTRQS